MTMQTEGIKQRSPLYGHHQRKQRGNGAVVRPNATLPPAEILAEAGAHADLVDAVRTWHQLIESERDQARAARVAIDAAAQADTDYRRKVRDALAAGADPATVKNNAEQHRTAAAAHEQFHNDARNEREKLGHRLGPLLEAAAPDMFASFDAQLEAAAEKVTKQLNAMSKAWGDYGTAWEIRRWLSHVALDGGNVGAFHGTQPMPKDATEGLAAITHALGELDRLRADEAEVSAYRTANGGGA